MNQRKLRKAIYSNVSNGTAGAFNVDPNNAGGPLLNTTSGIEIHWYESLIIFLKASKACMRLNKKMIMLQLLVKVEVLLLD